MRARTSSIVCSLSSGQQVDEIIARAVAEKALGDERRRGADWQQVIESAARLGAFDGEL
jgi:hypothetical protein